MALSKEEKNVIVSKFGKKPKFSRLIKIQVVLVLLAREPLR